MRFQYVFQEIATGLRRNLTMTIAVIVTVAISLGFFGGGLLVRAQANTMKDYWFDKIEISVFMCNAYDAGDNCAEGQVTPDQKERIQSTLETHSEVDQVFFESQDQAYELFKERYQDSIADNITPDQLQESFRVKLKNPERYEGVVSAVSGLPGVHQVVDQRQLLDKFFKVLNGLQVFAGAIAILMVVSATLLISNTIRVAAYSRRRETGIMRLVGASNFYIQLPFILEAAIAGLIGAFIACLGLVAMQVFFVDRILVPAFRFTAFIGWGDIARILPVLMATGIGIAAVASFVTLRKYLRV